MVSTFSKLIIILIAKMKILIIKDRRANISSSKFLKYQYISQKSIHTLLFKRLKKIEFKLFNNKNQKEV